MTTACWWCGEPIEDPPEIIGRYRAGRRSLTHRECWQSLGELELDLRAENAAPRSLPTKGPGPA